jgi:hypothetical protein
MRKSIGFLIFLFVIALMAAGCASTKRNAIVKRATASTCEAAKMGRNKLYYDKKYKRHRHHSSFKIEHPH